MKRKKLSNDVLEAVWSTEYIKDGVSVISVPLSSKIRGFICEMQVEGEPFKVIAVNGKLNRRDRRQSVKLLLSDVNLTLLKQVKFETGSDNTAVRGVMLYVKNSEVINEQTI